MIKGQVVSGDFSKIIMRAKSGEHLELGELLVIENNDEKFILQVYELQYGSQISTQNLELVSGINLEEGKLDFMDPELRNYQLAFLKPLISVIPDRSRICKKLPPFFSSVRGITTTDLSFITKPAFPFYMGKLRSGSKPLDVDIFLPGDKVFSEHV